VARAEQVQSGLHSGAVLPDTVSGGTASGVVASVEPRRRERRWLYVLAAAAGVLGLTAVAVLGVPPSTRVSTNALLPESAQLSGKGADDGSGLPPVTGADEVIAPVAANKPAAETEDLAPARDGARLAGDGTRTARTSRPSLTTIPELTDAPPSAPAPSAEAKNRVAQALSQPAPAQASRAPSSAATPKRAPKRATLARRAKPAPAAAGANAANAAKTPAATKVDCRQPFWIDEGGIRRLKMACL
jgi:hypothetical protein